MPFRELLVSQLMSSEVVTLRDDENVSLAGSLLHLARIRHLPVVDKDDKLVGLVTHRDLLKAQYMDEPNVCACDVMIQDIVTTTPTTPVLDAARLLHEHKYGCLPVLEDGNLVGIITEADFVEFMIDGLQDLRATT